MFDLRRLGNANGRKGAGQAAARALERADAARDAGDWDKARPLYRAALDAGMGDRAGIWVQYGHACKESGDREAAGDAYDAARRLAPDDGDVCLQIGHLRKVTGRPIAAAAMYFWAWRLDRSATGALAEFVWLGFSRMLALDLLADPQMRAPEDVVRFLYLLRPSMAMEVTASRWLADRLFLGDDVAVRRSAA